MISVPVGYQDQRKGRSKKLKVDASCTFCRIHKKDL